MLISLFRKLICLGLAIFVLFAIYVYGLSDINSHSLVSKAGDKTQSYFFDTPHQVTFADTLVVQAHQEITESGRVDVAEQLLIQALQVNPSSGRAASSLLSIYSSQGDAVKSEKMADLSSSLWPAHTYTRSRLAEFWLKEDRLDRVVDEWNILLVRNGELQKELFPLLKDIVEDARARSLIGQFVFSPPKWWDSFFGYLSRELSLENLTLVYKSRIASNVPVSVLENSSYVNRLIKEGYYEQANDEWFVALEPHQMQLGGFIYDGGFEGEVFNKGFSWFFYRSKNPRIKTDITYGIEGRKALHVVLRKKDQINFRHVSQTLILEPGDYEFSLRYRADSLKTTKGLVWRIRCSLLKGSPVIAESDAILGSQPWSSIKLLFNVPNNCGVQLLRLEAASRFRHDHYFNGSVWFDGLNIRKKFGEE